MFRFLKNYIKSFKSTTVLNVAFDSGGRRKPTIILLHGIAATSKTWDPLLKELDTENNRVITLDLLGFGQSPKPTDCEYTVDDHIMYIRDTIRKLHIHKPYKIVGHSMGAIIAARYSYLFRHEISSQYLLSLPLYIKNGGLHTNISRTHTDIYLNAYKFLAEQKQFTIINSQRLRKLLRISDGVDVNEENWNSFRLSLINTIMNQDTYNDIKDIEIPTNIIFGTFDEFMVQESVSKLAEFKHVKIIKLIAINHLLGPKFASIVAKQIIG